jgi:hypothetical protein
LWLLLFFLPIDAGNINFALNQKKEISGIMVAAVPDPTTIVTEDIHVFCASSVKIIG